MECFHAEFNGFEFECFLSGDLCEYDETSMNECGFCEDFMDEEEIFD